MNTRTSRTEATREQFVEIVSEIGNISHACRLLGLSRSRVYEWRTRDPAFAAEWDRALQLGASALEDEAHKRAMEGSDYLIVFLLRALKPEKYRERSTVDLNTRMIADYRSMTVDELQAKLDELRREQDRATPTMTLPPSNEDMP